jgi:hypothetical protein
MGYADILLSPATIWNAPVGEPLPDETTVAYGAAWGGNWVQFSLTKTPVTLNRDVSTFNVFVEQTTVPLRRTITEENMTIETQLAEFTGDVMALVMGGTNTITPAGAAQVAFEKIVGGGEWTLPEGCWGIEGKHIDADGDEFPVRFFFYRATVKLGGELSFQKGDYVGIPTQIEALGDTSKPVGSQLYEIHRVTAAATG